MNKLLVSGKGAYIWQPRSIGTPAQVASDLEQANASFAAIKINDAGYVYPGLEDYIDAIRDKGIQVIGWGYIYLRWNPLAEARGTVDAINKYKVEAYLIDAEAHALYQYPGAKVYAAYLRSAFPTLPMGLNSYWKPSWHPFLPYKALRGISDFDVPQVYWRGYQPVEKLAQSKAEYAAMTPKLPFAMAAGDMYFDRNLKPTPEQVTQFLTACKDDPEIKAAVMWSMDQKTKVPELWDAFARFDWQTGQSDPPGDVPAPPERQPLYSAVVTAWAGLNVRNQPNTYGNKPLRALRLGTRVDVWKEIGGWCAINSDYTEWCYGTYLKQV